MTDSKPRIAVFAGPMATIMNSAPLVTSNLARLRHGLPPRNDGWGQPLRFDVLPAERRTDLGDGDVAPERLGHDFFPYRPPHLRREPPRKLLATVTNAVQDAMSSGGYRGGLWLEGSPFVEETTYWLNLLIAGEHRQARPLPAVGAIWTLSSWTPSQAVSVSLGEATRRHLDGSGRRPLLARRRDTGPAVVGQSEEENRAFTVDSEVAYATWARSTVEV